jgi:hypothetical protein
MARHKNTNLVLHHVRELGLGAVVDEDGDIRIDVGSIRMFVQVSDLFIKCFLLYKTSAPVNALATLSKRVQRDLIVGRLTYPDGGGGFEVSYAHAYDGEVRDFDVEHPIRALDHVRKSIIEMAEELGYQI